MTITKEYQNLIEKRYRLESEKLSLPTGYISKKIIKGKEQYYLQKREGEKIVSRYIPKEQVSEVITGIERRKEIVKEIYCINERLAQLEKAAELIDKNVFCSMRAYKLSQGMDALKPEEKEESISFGNAMNAIEGVGVSKETAEEIKSWENGSKSFLVVFESVLKRYGFPVEARK